MNISLTIKDWDAAVSFLSALRALGSLAEVTQVEAGAGAPSPLPTAPAEAKGKKGKAKTQPTPPPATDEAEPVAAEPEAPEPMPEEPPQPAEEIRIDDVRVALNAYAEKHDVVAAKKVIAEVGGAEKLDQVDRAKYPALLAALAV